MEDEEIGLVEVIVEDEESVDYLMLVVGGGCSGGGMVDRFMDFKKVNDRVFINCYNYSF